MKLSITENISKVQISPSGDLGAFISTPLKSISEGTMVNLCGRENIYRILAAKFSTEEVIHQEWVDVIRKLS